MNIKIEKYIISNYFELLKISKKICRGHQLHEDLLQFVLLELYEKDEIKLKKYDDDDIKYFIIAVMKINWISNTSPFHYQIRREIRRYNELPYNLDDHIPYEEDNEMDERIRLTETYFSELDWFNKALFQMYLTLGSLKKVAKKTGIPLSSISRYINESKIKIKNNVNKNM